MAKGKPRGGFFYARVAVLLSVLVVVVLYAAQDTWRRNRRNDWDHTLDVALVVLKQGDVDPNAIQLMRERVPALEARLESEMRRRRPGSTVRPFHIDFFGPVEVNGAPALADSGDVIEHAQQMYAQWRTFRGINQSAEVHPGAFDSVVYVTVARPTTEARKLVEGASEQGGRIATVQIELAKDMVDIALFVSAHELLHTLGATDKYDATGRTKIPEGLAEPDAVPLYPQKFAEIMARNRVIAEGKEKIPERLDELAIGPYTAREIGWILP